jgi:glycosyltransferase involved in cell wall biosynthesis
VSLLTPDQLPAALGEAPPERRARVLHLLPDLAIGGGQTIVLNHLHHVDHDRFEVVVAVLAGGAELTDEAAAATGRDVVDLAYEGARPWRTVPRLVRLLREESIDLVHVHSDQDRKLGHLAGLACRIPVVGHLHAEWVHLGPMTPARPTAPRRARARVAGWARDRVEARAVRHYVAESVRVQEIFRPLVHQPISVLDQAIPIDRFHGDRSQRDRIRLELGIASSTPVLICVSRLVVGKGQGALIEAMVAVGRRHADAVLLLVGDGCEAASLRAEAERLGVAGSVRFLGSRQDVPDLLDAADVFVFASENEGFGLAVLEGMAAALPAVAFRIPSLQEFVVAGETGVLVDGRDPDDLAAAATAYLDDPATAARHGAAGREVVRTRFSPSSVARSFEAVYDTVLGTPAGTRIKGET